MGAKVLSGNWCVEYLSKQSGLRPGVDVVSTRGNQPGCTHGREASLYITSGGCVFTKVYQIRTPLSLRPYSCCDMEALALTDGDVTLALSV